MPPPRLLLWSPRQVGAVLANDPACELYKCLAPWPHRVTRPTKPLPSAPLRATPLSGPHLQGAVGALGAMRILSQNPLKTPQAKPTSLAITLFSQLSEAWELMFSVPSASATLAKVY